MGLRGGAHRYHGRGCEAGRMPGAGQPFSGYRLRCNGPQGPRGAEASEAEAAPGVGPPGQTSGFE
jgi:hypothetical protein